jgi:hypothetical protein
VAVDPPGIEDQAMSKLIRFAAFTVRERELLTSALFSAAESCEEMLTESGDVGMEDDMRRELAETQSLLAECDGGEAAR